MSRKMAALASNKRLRNLSAPRMRVRREENEKRRENRNLDAAEGRVYACPKPRSSTNSPGGASTGRRGDRRCQAGCVRLGPPRVPGAHSPHRALGGSRARSPSEAHAVPAAHLVRRDLVSPGPPPLPPTV